MKTKQILAASGFILALGIAQPASAVLSFAFDPTGTASFGTYTGLTTIDQAPGNALAVGGLQAVRNFVTGVGPTTFTLDYQANLNSILGTNTYSNGVTGNFFNFTMQLQEQVLSAGGGGTTATFTASSGIIKMFQSAAPGNNLTGAGFGGTKEILSASFDISQFQSSSFTTVQGVTGDINQFTAGNGGWGTTQTVQGSGGSVLGFRNVVADTNYFSGLTGTSVLEILANLTTSQNLPFTTVDPSLNFVWAGAISNVGPTNGLLTGTAPDVLFTADLSQSFNSRAVPEAETLLLLGLGLAGLALSRKHAQA